MQLQPLRRKGLQKTGDLRVGHHAIHLLRKSVGPVQLTRARGGKKRFVRHGTPEKIGESAGQLEVVDLGPFFIRRPFLDVKKTAGHQHARERRAVRRLEGFAGLLLGRDQFHVTLNLGVLHRPTPSPLDESLKARPDLIGIRFVCRQQAFALGQVDLGFQRPFGFDPVDD